MSQIKDSGERRVFETGAVRDIQEGKGRCDLMPLDVIGIILNKEILIHIENFKRTGSPTHLAEAIKQFSTENDSYYIHLTMFLDVSQHFEQGALKYGENNWQKGIEAKSYIDSAVRHYLKWLRGDKDERHDRAFIWNLICCWWTCNNIPKLNNYRHRCEDCAFYCNDKDSQLYQVCMDTNITMPPDFSCSSFIRDNK